MAVFTIVFLLRIKLYAMSFKRRKMFFFSGPLPGTVEPRGAATTSSTTKPIRARVKEWFFKVFRKVCCTWMKSHSKNEYFNNITENNNLTEFLRVVLQSVQKGMLDMDEIAF
jgi:hypothetical protein